MAFTLHSAYCRHAVCDDPPQFAVNCPPRLPA
jgi:hypothetical protein